MSVIERMFESSRKSFVMTEIEIGVFWIGMLVVPLSLSRTAITGWLPIYNLHLSVAHAGHGYGRDAAHALGHGTVEFLIELYGLGGAFCGKRHRKAGEHRQQQYAPEPHNSRFRS